MEYFVVILVITALVFSFLQFIDLMRRTDAEFPGRFDKPVWAAAILLTNVFGALAYYICKPQAAPISPTALKAEFAARLEAMSAGDASTAT